MAGRTTPANRTPDIRELPAKIHVDGLSGPMCRAGEERRANCSYTLRKVMTTMITGIARATAQNSHTQVTKQNQGIRLMIGALAIALLLSVGAARRAQAQSLKVLHVFTDSTNDGGYPQANLIRDTSGNLYGTTSEGGEYNAGTVFKLDPSDTLTVLHSFGTVANDGTTPVAGLVLDASSGYLYGTTERGGGSYDGTVFKVDTSGNNYSVLHSFTGYNSISPSNSDGANPEAGLFLDSSNHLLYGTTRVGGSNNDGTVFKIDTSGSNYSVFYSFSGGLSDGQYPEAGLVMDSTGNLYGTTFYGGLYYVGTVFKLDSTDGFTLLHSFAGHLNDGALPQAGLVMDSSGYLYGTTAAGGAYGYGNAFKIDTSGNNFAVLHNFSDGDGQYPKAGLVLDSTGNNLYGTAYFGGSSGEGTAFKMDTSGNNFAVLANFSPSQGENPQASLLIDPSGNLYGTTRYAGSSYGTVFEIATTPQAAIQGIITQVESLASQGVLNQGQENSLVTELQHAINMVNAGKINGAIGNLESFIDDVNNLLNSGVLTSDQGASLINAATSVIEQLQAM